MDASRLAGNGRVGICTLLCSWAVLAALATAAWGADDGTIKFADEPAAHALYDQMLETLRQAKSLSYVCHYQREAAGRFKSNCAYRVWLKKPNFFRMESETIAGEPGGVMIGDGEQMWVYWPRGRPRWSLLKETAESEKTRFSSYWTKPAPPRKHSIWHEARLLGSGMSYPILEMSVFHGYVDPMDAHLNGVRSLGTEVVAGERCDQIEVSLVDAQRRWTLWVSQRDHLPRKLQEIVRVEYDVVTHEEWSSVALGAEIPAEKFVWKPPADWHEWQLPGDDEYILQPGAKAPDFDLAGAGGERIRLSDYRGKPLWLCFWRIGCPPCREELPFLQELYTKTKDQGFVVLAVNVSDDRKLTLEFLQKEGITLPTILDTSEAADKVCTQDYGSGAVPMNFVIDGEGIVVDGWIGYEEGNTRAAAALKKVGIDLTKISPKRSGPTGPQKGKP